MDMIWRRISLESVPYFHFKVFTAIWRKLMKILTPTSKIFKISFQAFILCVFIYISSFSYFVIISAYSPWRLYNFYRKFLLLQKTCDFILNFLKKVNPTQVSGYVIAHFLLKSIYLLIIILYWKITHAKLYFYIQAVA